MTNLAVEGFWEWFREHASRMVSEEDSVIVDEMHEILCQIDDGLAVEIATRAIHGRDIREVIISGCGRKSSMQKAKEIVEHAPRDNAWRFIALKPARGFDFSIAAGGQSISASDLYFSCLESRTNPGKLGILIHGLSDLGHSDDTINALWLVVETGIGEELASKISVLKVDSKRGHPESAIPLRDLESFVKWFFAKDQSNPGIH